MLPSLTTLCVFCGSNPGRTSEYLDYVEDLATQLAESGIRIVYGGAKVGTMGALADAALRAGGEVIGVIPSHQVGDEIAHTGLTELHVVDSMHDRKARMSQLADGFVALPGGLGTLEEFAEIVTWAQLGIHSKPTGLLNTSGYYDSFLAFLDHAVGEHFLRPEDRNLVLAANSVRELLDKMWAWSPAVDQRWRSVNESTERSGGVSRP
ncbi:TIGR00730 family Rossman fold protein [Pseudonocardia ammonioxydans]|uniref:LOG family protein n=1 Tax=Pseudonocardia ammonioxydans TaxID=260086 RepID=UPI001FE59464|nr:TIGR00730 family Rossman fold protein [Pseudonocardia ammonioxydans]